jgi:signal transduction protein with GAF and PtsI domain
MQNIEELNASDIAAQNAKIRSALGRLEVKLSALRQNKAHMAQSKHSHELNLFREYMSSKEHMDRSYQRIIRVKKFAADNAPAADPMIKRLCIALGVVLVVAIVEILVIKL